MLFFKRKKKREVRSTLQTEGAKKGKRQFILAIDKRQKFVLGVIILSGILFVSEFQFGRSGLVVAVILGILMDAILYWAIKEDLKENFTPSVFILPFFYSLSFGLFYFLVPARLIFRLLLTAFFAFGAYSLFLSKNIFTVSSIRTIALLSGARIVSFILTMLSYFFLSNIIFTLHLHLIFVLPLIALYTFPLAYQSLWSYAPAKTPNRQLIEWAGGLTLCMIEIAAVVWFWPSTPTVLALFLAGFFYTIVGISHVWFEKRLFRGVMWEYVWVGATVCFVLLLFTSWGK
jgi:hypothetical protein